MKKILIFLTIAIMSLFLVACGEKKTEENGNKEENNQQYITSEEVDLRQMVVQYMYDMAKLQWTASQTLNYSAQGSPSLIYEQGKTYLGMVYNNNATGLENFKRYLDASGTLVAESDSWNESPGNSCATSIEHAWQLVCASVEYQYSVDMLPYYEETGVLAVGDIDWSQYDGGNTTISVLNKNDRETVYEAYALGLPGDAMVRYLNTGGHALMITKEPTIVRNDDGTINPEQSYVYLTDQNNLLNTLREYPSSWKVDHPISFMAAYMDGYLPVTAKELQEGKAPVPTFEMGTKVKAEDLAKGFLKGSVKSNYCIHEVHAELLSNGEVIASAADYPYTRNYGFKNLRKDLGISDLAAGTYTLKIDVKVGLAEKTIVEVEFTK